MINPLEWFKSKKDGPPVVSLVVFIIDWSRHKQITAAFEKADARIQYSAKGKGTASKEILDLLGIGAPDKAVVLSLEEASRLGPFIKDIADKVGLQERGVGVAFSVPLSSINTPVLGMFSDEQNESNGQNDRKEQKKASENEEAGIMETKKRSDLIMCILNQGYSDEFMAEARKAGAGGGTVLSVRGAARQSKVKFFGISVQNEKEIIMVLSTREKKNAIMSAVSEKFGAQSDAEGIVFSLPADNITGIELH
jgi:nitrogen regulatory protein PII